MLIKINKRNDLNKIISESEYVVVDFYADWCSPCKALAPIIDSLSEELSEVNFVKVNVDQEEGPMLAKEYKITSIPTLIYFKKGEAKDSSFGFIAKHILLKNINNLKK